MSDKWEKVADELAFSLRAAIAQLDYPEAKVWPLKHYEQAKQDINSDQATDDEILAANAAAKQRIWGNQMPKATDLGIATPKRNCHELSRLPPQ